MKKYVQLLLILLFIAVCGCTFYFYSQWQKAIDVIKTRPGDEIAEITEVISQSMDLPQGETPALATVSDKEKLKDQQFFLKAENGDKVLVYSQASKAILYRPSTKRVIEVAPIYEDNSSNQEAQIAVNDSEGMVEQSTSTLRLSFYNGSGVPGKHEELGAAVRGKFVNAVTTVVTSTAGTYSGILVVDLNGKMSTESAAIAGLLRGKVGVLPATEEKPDADILIIIGK